VGSDHSFALASAAREAQASVGDLGLDQRLACAARASEALIGSRADIIESAVAEAGQPVRFARREFDTALGFIAALPEIADAIRPRPVSAVTGETTLEWAPYGVVLGWHAANSPVWVPTLVSLSALVGGNSVLCRPSSRVRTTSGLVLEAIGTAWPERALQIVDCDRDAAERLIWSDGVDAVVAHASSATCKRHLALLGRAYADGARLRPYIPEGSGNDAFLVLPGADIPRAAAAIATAAFSNSGQLCMAAKRIIVVEQVWPALCPALVDAVDGLVVGDPRAEGTDIAPLPHGRALARAREDLAEALACGGEIVAGGEDADGVLTPTIVRLSPDMRSVRLWREESFAPVRALVVADDVVDAIRLANDSVYALGAAVFGGTDDLLGRLRAARIVKDESPLYQDPHLVVGGVGESGLAGARPKLEQLVYARRVHRGTGGR